jgi:hypothetical protein
MNFIIPGIYSINFKQLHLEDENPLLITFLVSSEEFSDRERERWERTMEVLGVQLTSPWNSPQKPF